MATLKVPTVRTPVGEDGIWTVPVSKALRRGCVLHSRANTPFLVLCRGAGGRVDAAWRNPDYATSVTHAPRLHRYTFQEYLVLEASSTVRHEFLAGEIYAIAGGTPQHAALAMAVGASLFSQTRGGPCRVHSSDLRVRALATGLTTYPDVTVVCGPYETDPPRQEHDRESARAGRGHLRVDRGV